MRIFFLLFSREGWTWTGNATCIFKLRFTLENNITERKQYPPLPIMIFGIYNTSLCSLGFLIKKYFRWHYALTKANYILEVFSNLYIDVYFSGDPNFLSKFLYSGLQRKKKAFLVCLYNYKQCTLWKIRIKFLPPKKTDIFICEVSKSAFLLEIFLFFIE